MNTIDQLKYIQQNMKRLQTTPQTPPSVSGQEIPSTPYIAQFLNWLLSVLKMK